MLVTNVFNPFIYPPPSSLPTTTTTGDNKGPDLSAKPWKPKEQPKKTVDEDFTTEWDDLLEKATEDELVDLAGTLV